MKLAENVTKLLNQAKQGDHAAERQLYEAVYDELRAIAHRQMSNESPGNTGQATTLVHDWYVSVASSAGLHDIHNHHHLLNTAAKAMRHLLIDRARARKRDKRGGKMHRIALDELTDSYESRGLDLLALEEGLESLRKESPRRLEIFLLEFLCGLSATEIAEIIGTGVNNVYVSLRGAKAHIRKYLPKGNP